MEQLSLRLGPDGQTIRHATSRSDSGTNRPEDEEPPEPDANRKTYLSKSRYLTGRENPREMWFEARGDSSPEIGDRWRMEQGKLVGELARQRFPDGVFVGGSPSNEQLQAGKPLFEARFTCDGGAGKMSVRVDILRPCAGDGWGLTEVKSSTLRRSSSVEDAKRDVAFQVWVLEKAGLNVQCAEIMHLNPGYVQGKGGDLFERTLLGEDRGKLVSEVKSEAPGLAETLRQPEPPNLWPSRACNTCDCPEPCRKLPEQSIFTLPRLYWGHMDEMLQEGLVTLNEVEGHSHLKEKHARYIEAVKDGKPRVDRTAIREALREVEYPIHFLDFEAIDYALPQFEGTQPWQKIPFQYSLHVLEEGGNLTHSEYLHDGKDDPRPPLAEQLLSNTQERGSVVVYNASFERKLLKGLVEALPYREQEVQSLIGRLWDQAQIFKNWHFAHPAQKGSWSLKKVLPVFDSSLEYDDLGVQEGMEAAVTYSAMVDPATPDAEAEKLREGLLDYCERDTYAMVVIHEELAGLVGFQ